MELYVDHSIGAGDRDFEEFSTPTERRFDSKRRETAPFEFTGMEVDKSGKVFNVYQL